MLCKLYEKLAKLVTNLILLQSSTLVLFELQNEIILWPHWFLMPFTEKFQHHMQYRTIMLFASNSVKMHVFFHEYNYCLRFWQLHPSSPFMTENIKIIKPHLKIPFSCFWHPVCISEGVEQGRTFWLRAHTHCI